MWRGEDMTICDVYIQTDAGFDVLQQIGKMECVQFIDMNWNVSPMDKHFVSDLCRCADMEHQLHYMRDELTAEGVPIKRLRKLFHIKPLHPTEMFEFENMIDSWTKDVKDMSANYNSLKQLRSETKEIHYVLNHLHPILGDVETGLTKFPKLAMTGGESTMNRRQLKIITGVVERSNSHRFQLMIWRISHGNIYYREANYDDYFLNPLWKRDVRKVAFVIACYGDELHQRILKICSSFSVNLYRWPETHKERVSTLKELLKRMQEMDKVLQRTKAQRVAAFRNLSAQWETWMTQVMKAKAIYHQLNFFNLDISSNTLIGQCWLPEKKYEQVETVLEHKSKMAGARSFMVKTTTDRTPPTFYRTNEFTVVFQDIISSYQVGRYKEVNPGIFTIISFPFFFGVMFGDVGHGILLVIYSLWMLQNARKFKFRQSTNEVWNLIFKGRYMILLMGLFAMFMGFLYNEYFSLTTKMMRPFWLNTYHGQELEMNPYLTVLNTDTKGYVYRFGMDPGLKLAVNGFRHENSVKMKLSIILGVAHICVGLLLCMWNYIYFHKYYRIIFHFLPQLLFVGCIYGWLIYFCFFKWLVKMVPKDYPHYDFRSWLPELTYEFLHMILWTTMANKIEQKQVVDTLYRNDYVKDQLKGIETAKVVLFHIGLLCFPVMFLGSPIYLYIKNKLKQSRLERSDAHRLYKMRGQDSDELKKNEEFSLGHLLLRRFWRTAEFGLATVSHMASYLRLWALSMAHTLLSDFLWQMTMRKALHDVSPHGVWKIVLLFFVFAVITVFMLVVMDGLAVFVHVLRLHWIEFMSKFFKGGGTLFRPFTISTVLDKRDYKLEDETSAVCKIRKQKEASDLKQYL